MLQFISRCVYITGYMVLAYCLYRTWQFTTFQFFPSKNSLARYKRNPQAWALITGSSAGIGFGFAQELAARGFGIVLTSHKADELDEAASTIKSQTPNASIEIIVLNAITATGEEIKKALHPLYNLPITIIINNVGGQPSTPAFKSLSDYTPTEIDASINLNARFGAHLTSTLLPTLTTNSPSLIITITSGGRTGLPLLSMYSATKAFTSSLSHALSRELASSNVDSLLVVAGDVYSQSNTMALTAGAPQSREFAKMALDRVGSAVARGEIEMSPYWLHAMQSWLLDVLPEAAAARLLRGDMQRRKEVWEKAQ